MRRGSLCEADRLLPWAAESSLIAACHDSESRATMRRGSLCEADRLRRVRPNRASYARLSRLGESCHYASRLLVRGRQAVAVGGRIEPLTRLSRLGESCHDARLLVRGRQAAAVGGRIQPHALVTTRRVVPCVAAPCARQTGCCGGRPNRASYALVTTRRVVPTMRRGSLCEADRLLRWAAESSFLRAVTHRRVVPLCGRQAAAVGGRIEPRGIF